jgi:SAM-dependent methyltransferase
MLASSRASLLERLADNERVLDVGGWAKPLDRADWVIDLLPYETRGLYGGEPDPSAERFSAETWVERDICDRRPWPFEDGQFDFVVCSHTLEDVRDPIWVCSEMTRVGAAGYVEVPSRLEEQTYGLQGPWAGWSHHRWLVDVTPGDLLFVAKPHVMHSRESDRFTRERWEALTPEQRVQTLWWRGGFDFRERVFIEAAELDEYLARFVRENGGGDGRGHRRWWRR